MCAVWMPSLTVSIPLVFGRFGEAHAQGVLVPKATSARLIKSGRPKTAASGHEETAPLLIVVLTDFSAPDNCPRDR
jgi:hypothetical protein